MVKQTISVNELTSTFGKGRILPLDLLRGMAALLVAIGHFGEWGGVRFEETFAFCVPFFFMLSGYVITHAYGDAIAKSGLNIFEFSSLRLARLYPLHAITFLAVVLFYMCIEIARKFIVLPISETVGLHANFLQFVETVTLTHFLLGQSVSFNTPSWSISIEFWCGFYIYLLCSPTVSKHWKIAFAWIGLLLLILIQYQGGLYGADRLFLGVIDTTYLIGIGCFSIGWLIHDNKKCLSNALKIFPACLFWLIAFVTAAFMVLCPNAKNYDSAIYLSFALTISGLSQGRFSYSGYASLVMKKAGDISYGIYLWHIPLMLIIVAFARLTEKLTGIYVVHTIVLEVIFILTLLLLASVSYRYLELPAKYAMKKTLFCFINNHASRFDHLQDKSVD
jgi:peptidoglycan/LPS O-acetylase OafA/YrhL